MSTQHLATFFLLHYSLLSNNSNLVAINADNVFKLIKNKKGTIENIALFSYIIS